MRTITQRLSVVCIAALLLVQAAWGQPLLERTGYLPEFETSRSNLESLEQSLEQTGELAEILRQGNDELSAAVQQYNQDRCMETKDRIYNLLGGLAGKTISQIDNITANKDRMTDGLHEIIIKMSRMQTSLGSKQETFEQYSDELRQQADSVTDELRALARQIRADSENTALRREFRRKLYELRSLDQRYKTAQAHQRLNQNFSSQIQVAHDFFKQLDENTEQLMVNLQEQREFLVLKIGLLRDAAQMESWLRDEGQGTVSAFGMLKKISELTEALTRFNAATDVLIEMNDIGTLIDSLPDAGELLGFDSASLRDGERFEDRYVDYFLSR